MGGSLAFFPPSRGLFLAPQNQEADQTERGSTTAVRVWAQTDLPLSPLGLRSDATSSKRPSLTTPSLFYSLLTVFTTVGAILS